MKWYERVLLCILIVLLAVSAAEEAHSAQELTVSAALSLKAPFDEFGNLYKKRYPGSMASFNFGPSGTLQKQIEAGAPADIFASASPKEIDVLEKFGLLVPGTRHDFAGNSVVLVTSSSSGVRLGSLNDLKRADIKRVAIGNPATVPAGKYAEETLVSAGLLNSIRTKLVYAEHVRQIMDYVIRNEVDAGMVFLTDAMSGGRDIKIAIEAPESGHKPVVYTIAIIKGTGNEAAAKRFVELLLSKEGMEILRKYGFRAVKR